jgi:hypothetical protein
VGDAIDRYEQSPQRITAIDRDARRSIAIATYVSDRYAAIFVTPSHRCTRLHHDAIDADRSKH